jgi:hypothetical protein
MWRKIHTLLEDEVRRGNPPVFPSDEHANLRDDVEFLKGILKTLCDHTVVFAFPMNIIIKAVFEKNQWTLDDVKKELCGMNDLWGLSKYIFEVWSSRNQPHTLRQLISSLVPYDINDSFYRDESVPIQTVMYACWINFERVGLVWDRRKYRSRLVIEKIWKHVIPVPDTFIGTILCRKSVLQVLLVGNVNRMLPKDVWRLFAKALYRTRRDEAWFPKAKERKKRLKI